MGQKWIVYKKTTTVYITSYPLSLVPESDAFLVFSFFQHFDWKAIDTLSDIVERYKKSENLSKQMLVFS